VNYLRSPAYLLAMIIEGRLYCPRGKKEEWKHRDYKIRKKAVFSTLVSDRYLVLVVNSILRSRARKSASVL